MISELRNENRYITKADKLIAKWPRLDQKFWLQTQLGLNFDSLDRKLSEMSGDGIVMFRSFYANELQPGLIFDTLIEPYRGITIDGITFSQLSHNINSLLISQYNSNFGGSLGMNQIYDPANFDTGAIINCDLSGSNLNGVFAPYSDFINLTGKDVTLSNTIATGARMQNCTFKDSFITRFLIGEYVQVNDYPNAPEIPQDPTLKTVQFKNCNISEFMVGHGKIQNLLFEGCKLNSVMIVGDKDVTGLDAIMLDCDGYVDVSGKIIINNSNLYNSFFNVRHDPFGPSPSQPALPSDEPLTETQQSIATSEIPLLFSSEGNNELRFCKIMNSEILGNWRGSTFKGSQFYDSVNLTTSNFDASADISNCDFTDSDIDQVYPTKADLVNAVLSAEGAIWVDGTSVT